MEERQLVPRLYAVQEMMRKERNTGRDAGRGTRVSTVRRFPGIGVSRRCIVRPLPEAECGPTCHPKFLQESAWRKSGRSRH